MAHFSLARREPQRLLSAVKQTDDSGQQVSRELSRGSATNVPPDRFSPSLWCLWPKSKAGPPTNRQLLQVLAEFATMHATFCQQFLQFRDTGVVQHRNGASQDYGLIPPRPS
jgi:hypothetical protein